MTSEITNFVIAFSVLLFAFSLVSRKISGIVVTASMIFVAAGLFLSLAVFFIFGTTAATKLPVIGFSEVVCALLSLTVICMVPVAISLIGANLVQTCTEKSSSSWAGSAQEAWHRSSFMGSKRTLWRCQTWV
ncbi:Na+/H+ antiporter [Methanosarcina sp. WWM596]|nr:Na+/H+ antiporter [Methanosarcina sp. WWM596]